MAQLKRLADAYHRATDYFLSDQEPVPELVLWRERPPTPKFEELQSRLLTLAQHYHKLEVLCEERRVHQLPECEHDRAAFGTSEALHLACDVRKQLGLGDQPAGVLLNVLEETCGVKVFHLSYEPRGSAACTLNEESGASILLNSKHSRAERNWDLAHELFHLLTWKSFRSVEVPERSDWDDEETLANRFAGALLVPEEALKIAVDSVRGRRSKLSLDDVVDIARQFDVTPEMLLHRIAWVYRIAEDSLCEALAAARKVTERLATRTPESGPPERPARFLSLAERAFRNAKISTGTYAEFVGASRREAMKLLEEEPCQNAEVEVANPRCQRGDHAS
jgi:XRE family transcriptional regulator, fatty acid utilization regulator